MASDDDGTLYGRLGGSDAVAGAIGAFYERVLADSDLRPFFDGVDLDKLERMQTEFFTVALGGPGTYAGMSLADAHRGRGIRPRHLARFTEHLVATMLERGMAADAVDEVAARVAILGADVLDTTTEAG